MKASFIYLEAYTIKLWNQSWFKMRYLSSVYKSFDFLFLFNTIVDLSILVRHIDERREYS